MAKVLIAAEREIEYNVLHHAMETLGHTIVRSRDGLEALDAMRTHQPDVVLVNVLLPRLDGFSLYRRCQQDEQLRRLPMVLISTRSNDQKSERFAHELGAQFVGDALRCDRWASVIDQALTNRPPPLPSKTASKVLIELPKTAPAPAAKPVSIIAPLVAPSTIASSSTETPRAVMTSLASNAAVALAEPEDEVDAASEASLPQVPAIQPATMPEAMAGANHTHDSHEISLDLPAALLPSSGLMTEADTREWFDRNPAPMWLVDHQTQYMLDVNEAALRLFDYPREEFLRLTADALLAPGKQAGATQMRAFQTKAGQPLTLVLGARDVRWHHKAAELMVAHDTTERMRGQRAVADELRRQRVLLAAVPVPYAIVNGALRIMDVNELFTREVGLRRDQLLEMPLISLLEHIDEAQLLAAITQSNPIAATLKKAEGQQASVSIAASRVEMEGEVRLLAFLAQPDHLTAELPALALPTEAQPANDTSSDEPSSKLPVVAELVRYAEDADETTLLHYAMAQLAQAFGCPLALFGSLEAVTQSLEILALKQIPAPRAGQDYSGTVRLPAPWLPLLSKNTLLVDEATDESMLVKGLPEISSYAACSVTGDRREGQNRPQWLLVLGNRELLWSSQEQEDLHQITEVLVTVLLQKRAQSHVRAVQQRQAVSVDGMVGVIERLIESQDQYAHGSGRRVAALAVKIAKKLQLPTERIQALSLAARLHDLGHLALPRELLLLPRPYTHVERALVRTHIEHGARMLRTVDFGMEVASIVAQHHERLDGSGYPMGAKAEQIGIEARVLAVADVVDAMTTARAYRPAQELEVALAEVRGGAGTRFDANVVTACEQVFNDSDGVWPTL